MSEERDDGIVVLVDENGEEVEFECLDIVDMDGSEYAILLPYSEDEEEEGQDTDEVVILRIEENEDGDEAFVTVEDEEELNSVFEEFKRRMEEEYDFEE